MQTTNTRLVYYSIYVSIVVFASLMRLSPTIKIYLSNESLECRLRVTSVSHSESEVKLMHVCVAFVETQFKFVGASIHALKRNRIVYEHLGALYMPVRAENGPKFFGPARPVILQARPGPFRPGKFRELSLQCSRIVFYLFIFYRNICISGYFY
jgi:hypothetical protein